MPCLFPIHENADGKVVRPDGLKNVDAACFHRRSCFGTVNALARDVALVAQPAWPAAHAPCLVVAVKEEGQFQVKYGLVEWIYARNAPSPVPMEEYRVRVRIQNAAHLIRRGRVRWAAMALPVPMAAELAFHPDPRLCEYLRCLNDHGVVHSPLRSHCQVAIQLLHVLPPVSSAASGLRRGGALRIKRSLCRSVNR